MSLLEMFYDVDTFCVRMTKQAESHQLGSGPRGPQASLCVSEIMTILIHFHQSYYRDFKACYTEHVCEHLHREFPGLVSYTRFVELIPTALAPMTLYLLSRMGQTRGIAFIDSTPIPVCHNKRIFHHKVFDGFAARGKSRVPIGRGYFWGFKLHLVVNVRALYGLCHQGELLSFLLSPGNVDDRKPVSTLTKRLWGKLFGDKVYISQPLFERLFDQGIQLITLPKKRRRPPKPASCPSSIK